LIGANAAKPRFGHVGLGRREEPRPTAKSGGGYRKAEPGERRDAIWEELTDLTCWRIEGRAFRLLGELARRKVVLLQIDSGAKVIECRVLPTQFLRVLESEVVTAFDILGCGVRTTGAIPATLDRSNAIGAWCSSRMNSRSRRIVRGSTSRSLASVLSVGHFRARSVWSITCIRRTNGRVPGYRIVVTLDRRPPSPSLLDRSQRRNQSAAHGSIETASYHAK
jgi:hypothetical protein